MLSWRTVPTRLYTDETQWWLTIESDDDVTTIVQTFEVLKLNPIMERLFHLLIPAHRDRIEALRDDLRRLASVAETVDLSRQPDAKAVIPADGAAAGQFQSRRVRGMRSCRRPRCDAEHLVELHAAVVEADDRPRHVEPPHPGPGFADQRDGVVPVRLRGWPPSARSVRA